MNSAEIYMRRCIELANLGAGYVAPNPMVGAVLVCNDRIIGEGYHKQFGQAHAEVNCIAAVAPEDRLLISQSTLYVSLEPCAHYGKTPPCVDLILAHNIPRVVIGCADAFDLVNGRGLEKLRSAGVEVVTEVLETECRQLNKRFFTFHKLKRPYIILKWAQSANKAMAAKSGGRIKISNDTTNRLVHMWRSQERGIMIGSNTASKDDPQLNVRLVKGRDPVRLVLNLNQQLDPSLKIFDNLQQTIVFNTIRAAEEGMIQHVLLHQADAVLPQIMDVCYQHGVSSILVEGGAILLQSLIDSDLWDEARVIENKSLFVEDPLLAPVLHNATLQCTEKLGSDTIAYYQHKL